MPVLVATFVADPAKAPLSDARASAIAQGVAAPVDRGDPAALLFARKDFVAG